MDMMKTSLRVWRLISLSLLALANLSTSQFSLWSFHGAELNRDKSIPFNSTSTPVAQIQRALIGEVEYCIQLDEGRAIVRECSDPAGEVSWQSPPGWQVKEAFFSDLNLDGENEIALLVWRPFQPWPVDRFMPFGGRIDSFQDKNGLSCHLILMGAVDGRFQELWAGSAMVDPIHSLQAVDLDGDDNQELAALEYEYDGNPQGSSLVIWHWNGFGFSLEARQAGGYSTLLVLQTNSGRVLLTR